MCCGREFNTDKGVTFLLNTGSELFNVTTHSPTEILPWNGNPIYLRIKKEEKELLLLFFMSFYQRQGSTPPSGTASQRFVPIVRRASSPLRNRGMSSGRGLPTAMDCPSRYGGNPLQRSPTSLVGDEPIAEFVRHQFQRRGVTRGFDDRHERLHAELRALVIRLISRISVE